MFGTTGTFERMQEYLRAAPFPVALRDSKDPHGPVLVVTPEDWRAFTATVKAGALGPR